jgi:hypothetical protein
MTDYVNLNFEPIDPQLRDCLEEELARLPGSRLVIRRGRLVFKGRGDLGVVVSRAAMPAACRRCSGAFPAERPTSARGVKLGRVVINRPVVFEYSELASVRVLGAGER